MSASHRISFTRLARIEPDRIARHMSDPRMARHMPLLRGPWSVEDAAAFIARKEAFWRRDGLGHWALLYAGAYAGWGGFQKEGAEWDFGLALTPETFGLGAQALAAAFAIAAADDRVSSATFLLPPTRGRAAAMRRIGAAHEGEARLDGARFMKFRLPVDAATARRLRRLAEGGI